MNYLNGIADCIKVIEDLASLWYEQAQVTYRPDKTDLLNDYQALRKAKAKLDDLQKQAKNEKPSSPWKRITNTQELPPLDKRVLVRDTHNTNNTRARVGRLKSIHLSEGKLFSHFHLEHYAIDEIEGFNLEWCEIPT